MPVQDRKAWAASEAGKASLEKARARYRAKLKTSPRLHKWQTRRLAQALTAWNPA